MNLFKFNEITFSGIRGQVNYFLQKTYNKADQLFSPASPYGQILTVTEELYQLSFLYLKRALQQFDMNDINANNYNIIRSNAIVAGHNPSRTISSTGTLRLKPKVNIDLESDLPNKKVVINNKTTIKNSSNNLFYAIDLGGADTKIFNVEQGESIFVNIIQGEWKTASFTGDGEINQSYQVNISGERGVENFNVEVTVNGEYWEIKNHLYEMIPNEKACVVKTSFNGGVDVVFGNGSYGEIPPIGSRITVEYLLSDGNRGNIYRRTANDWSFVDDVFDSNGITINFESIFDIYINNDISFGAERESLEFMRNILPLNSNNFVLALPQQYAYQIKKLGVFSYVNAYKENETIKILAAPNIRLFKNQNSDYFSVALDAFELDENEKDKIDSYLKREGNIQLTQKYTINSPVLSYYIMNIHVRTYSDTEQETINNQILDRISTYFLNLNRQDRIPKKDLINVISEIDGIDSVSINFISKKNEDYHRQNQKVDPQLEVDLDITKKTINKKGTIDGYEPNKVLGLDPILGDIVFKPNEYPIIRGGWEDRNGIFYGEEPLDSFSSVNIINEGTTERKNITR